MYRKRISTFVFLIVIISAATLCVAQYSRWGRERRQPDRSQYPTWEIDNELKHDVFTFVRIHYSSNREGRQRFWGNDYPDSDWNFSYRLQQLTTLEVDPDGKVIRLTDPVLFDYPFIYMNGVGNLIFSDEEAAVLRRYLLSGGFLMVDDFWGYDAWVHFYEQMKSVFPQRQPTELSLDHPIFHMVYNFDEKPQVPDIRTWRSGHMFEYRHGGRIGDTAPHFRGYVDDDGRLMALMCHNNDLGDGWEREGQDAEYFRQFSEKFSYPMGINIITYAMTH